MYLDANNLYRLAMSQKLPVNGFKWVKKLSKFDKHFINDYDEISIRDIFLKQMLNIQKFIQWNCIQQSCVQYSYGSA